MSDFTDLLRRFAEDLDRYNLADPEPVEEAADRLDHNEAELQQLIEAGDAMAAVLQRAHRLASQLGARTHSGDRALALWEAARDPNLILIPEADG